MKKQIDWTSLKLKLLCLKVQHQESVKITHDLGENICKAYILIKGSYLKCMKSSYKLNSKKTNDVIEKWAKDLNMYFSKIDKNGQLSTLKYVNYQQSIKSTVNITSHMAVLKKNDNNKYW